MSRKKTHEEYVKELEYKNHSIEAIDEYNGAHNKIKHSCKICETTWETTPTLALKGISCPKCKIKKLSEMYSKTHEQYVHEVNIINPYIEVVGYYINAKIKIKHKCKICDTEWSTMPSTIFGGRGCPECGNKKIGEKLKKTHDEYRKELIKKNKNIEIIGKYNGANTKVKYRCLVCNNEWNATPHSILNGHGCPNCAGNMKKNNESYAKKLNEINPNIKIMGSYINSKTKTEHFCKNCGYHWHPLPNDILISGRCPRCAEKSKGEVSIKDFLNNMNINYIPQKKFSNLKGVGGGLLSYDFYLPDYNILIEYQGEQHFRSVDYFGGEEKFRNQQEHDKRKRDYAKLHNINLLEIRYDEDVDTLLDKYFNNINNSNNLNSESLETVMPTIAI